MALRPSKFTLDEEISLAGKPMRVAGLVQFEGTNAQLITRYLLAETAGAPLILEESGERFSLLRPFPPGAQPQVTGGTITVVNEKYTLSGVRKLKVLGAAGQPPGGAPKAELLFSGLFEGQMGSLLRELTAGASAQVFFSSKPVAAEEVLSGEQRAARQEAERLAAEIMAQTADDEKDKGKGKSLQIAAICIVTVLVLLGLAYALLRRAG